MELSTETPQPSTWRFRSEKKGDKEKKKKKGMIDTVKFYSLPVSPSCAKQYYHKIQAGTDSQFGYSVIYHILLQRCFQ